jgi:hypothetical protein
MLSEFILFYNERRIHSSIGYQPFKELYEFRNQGTASFTRFNPLRWMIRYVHPSIVPETMASLSELLGETFHVSGLMLRLLQSLQHMTDTLIPSQLTPEGVPIYEYNLARIVERNNKTLAKCYQT